VTHYNSSLKDIFMCAFTAFEADVRNSYLITIFDGSHPYISFRNVVNDESHISHEYELF